MFIISQLWLTYHPRSTEVLLYTGCPPTSGEIYREDANDRTRLRVQDTLYIQTKHTDP